MQRRHPRGTEVEQGQRGEHRQPFGGVTLVLWLGARDVIAGYCVVNDVSERAFQMERGGQWTKGKSAETFNPAGPWLVTPDEIQRAAQEYLTPATRATRSSRRRTLASRRM